MIYQHILHKSNNVVLNQGCTKYCKDQKKSPEVSNKAEKYPERTVYRNRKVDCWFDQRYRKHVELNPCKIQDGLSSL